LSERDPLEAQTLDEARQCIAFFEADAVTTRLRIAKLESALRPFADRVYNDNGDVTYNTSAHDTEDLWRAYVALK